MTIGCIIGCVFKKTPSTIATIVLNNTDYYTDRAGTTTAVEGDRVAKWGPVLIEDGATSTEFPLLTSTGLNVVLATAAFEIPSTETICASGLLGISVFIEVTFDTITGQRLIFSDGNGGDTWLEILNGGLVSIFRVIRVTDKNITAGDKHILYGHWATTEISVAVEGGTRVSISQSRTSAPARPIALGYKGTYGFLGTFHRVRIYNKILSENEYNSEYNLFKNSQT